MNNNAQTFWLENLKLADRYNNWILEQIQPYLGRQVLEVGCGNGNFTVLLAQQCDRLLAIDLDREYVQITGARLNKYSQVTVQQQDINTLETTEKFDTIILLDVLEHLEHDVLILQKLNDLLSPAGNLIVKVPALNIIYGEMDRVIGHYRRYNKRSLNKTFMKANLPQPLIWYFNLAGIPGWWLNSKVLKRTIPPTNQVNTFNKIVPLLSKLESLIQPPIGLSLFAVTSKKIS